MMLATPLAGHKPTGAGTVVELSPVPGTGFQGSLLRCVGAGGGGGGGGGEGDREAERLEQGALLPGWICAPNCCSIP